jgi:hypothetical protein
MKTRILIALLVTVAALLAVLARARVHVTKTMAGEPSVICDDTASPSHPELDVVARASIEARQTAQPVAVPLPAGLEWSLNSPREIADSSPVVLRRITGTVTSAAEGYPISGATLTACLHVSDFVQATAQSDRTGHYELDVPPLAYQVICNAPGFAEQKQIVDARTRDVTLDIRLASKPPTTEILIRLTGADGRPFLATLEPAERKRFAALRPVFAAEKVQRGACAAGVNVFAVQARAVVADADGSWFRATIQGVVSGTCCLVLGERVIDVAAFDGHTTDVTLVASMDDLHGAEGSVRMLVVDKLTGRPFQGAHVRVVSDMAGERRGITGSDGVLIVEHVVEGEARVSVTSFDPERPGETADMFMRYELHDGEVRPACVVQGGRQTDLGRILLERTVSISGHVALLPDDSTLPSVSLSKQSDDDTSDAGFGPDIFRGMRGEVDKDGDFRFSGLRPGWYVVTTSRRVTDLFEGEVRSAESRTKSVEIDARFGDVSRVHLESPAVAEESLQQRKVIREHD